MVELFGWSEEEFNRRLEGSPIRRIGHERWLRNLAVGAGQCGRAGWRCGDRGGVAGARGSSVGDGARACAMGAGAARGYYKRLSRSADQSLSSEIIATPVTPRSLA
jgi:hypothetical protein